MKFPECLSTLSEKVRSFDVQFEISLIQVVGINQFCILSVRMNHCEAHLIVTSRVIDSKGLRLALVGVFFLITRQNDVCSVTWFLIGISSDEPVFKVRVFTNDYQF